jgi:hypothetical protein
MEYRETKPRVAAQGLGYETKHLRRWDFGSLKDSGRSKEEDASQITDGFVRQVRIADGGP